MTDSNRSNLQCAQAFSARPDNLAEQSSLSRVTAKADQIEVTTSAHGPTGVLSTSRPSVLAITAARRHITFARSASVVFGAAGVDLWQDLTDLAAAPDPELGPLLWDASLKAEDLGDSTWLPEHIEVLGFVRASLRLARRAVELAS